MNLPMFVKENVIHRIAIVENTSRGFDIRCRPTGAVIRRTAHRAARDAGIDSEHQPRERLPI